MEAKKSIKNEDLAADIDNRERYEIVYGNWKRNAPFLYDAFQSYSLEMSSFACAWGRTIESDNLSSTRRLYYSLSSASLRDRQTRRVNGAKNTLVVSQIKFPNRDCAQVQETNLSPQNYTADKIPHPGPISTIRCSPHCEDMIATQSHTSDIYIWNLNKLSNEEKIVHDLVLTGHGKADGDKNVEDAASNFSDEATNYFYAMEISSMSPLVLGGGSNPSVCLWSLEDASSTLGVSGTSENSKKRARLSSQQLDKHQQPELQCRQRFVGHTSRVEDVGFHPKQDCVFVGSMSNGNILFWDSRKGSRPVHRLRGFGTKSYVTSLDWNSMQSHHLLLGTHSSEIHLLDIRKMSASFSSTLDKNSAATPSGGIGKKRQRDATNNIDMASSSSDSVVNPEPAGTQQFAVQDEKLCKSEDTNHKNTLSVLDNRKVGTNTIFSKSTCPGDTISGKNGSPIVRTFRGNSQSISSVQWSPSSPSVFASMCPAGEMCIWDLKQGTGSYQIRQDLSDGFPPELMFRHMGHRGSLTTFSWCPDIPWTLATFSDNSVLTSQSPGQDSAGTLQIWRISGFLSDPISQARERLMKLIPSPPR